jgi:hypothetical protein
VEGTKEVIFKTSTTEEIAFQVEAGGATTVYNSLTVTAKKGGTLEKVLASIKPGSTSGGIVKKPTVTYNTNRTSATIKFTGTLASGSAYL